MNIVPVIDYLKGHVVLAKQGRRDKYRKINSLLSSSADVNSVIDGMLSVAGFKTIYIADLDSIQNHQLKICIWQQLCRRYSQIEFWLDLGAYAHCWQKLFTQQANARPVLGSESYATSHRLAASLHTLKAFNPLISIDIKNEKILGPGALLKEFTCWPSQVIILSLHQAGSQQGPDFKALDTVSPYVRAPSLIYGGGIRNINDIQALQARNVSAVMLASALHNGAIDKEVLCGLM